MATQRSSKRLSALKKSRKFRDLSRQESRRLHLEQLEDRRVMAVFVLPNNGELLNNGDTRTIAPQDLTFRFTEIPGLDATTIANGIRLTRAGGDGQFGQANDVVINPGFVGLGDNNREVIMRFAETLPDDTYQITIVGAGTTPLRDSAGNPINGGSNQTLNFRLDLGAQVIAVVPQPVRRLPNGTLAMTEVNPANPAATRSTQNMVYVYFNDDKLDPASATNREFYRLYVTKNTLDPSDDTEVTPTSVEYDQANNLVRLIFSQVASLDQLAPFNPTSGIKDPIGAFRLRVGTNESLRNGGASTVTQRLGSTDPGSSFASAYDLGTSITAGSQGASSAVAQAIEAQAYSLIWPGAIQEPGHRDIPAETHLNGGADTAGGITTIHYNFQDVIGTIPDGLGGFQTAFNLITENQKQRAREVLDLYSRYSGVQFIESSNQGFTIATGDPRVLQPDIDPNAIGGIAGGTLAIMDSNDTWDDSYGANWFQTAMHEIGHLLGLGHSYDLPQLTIQGDDGGLNSVGPEPVFPGDHDIAHMRHMYRPDSKDIDMYRFTLDGTGVLRLEAFAERLPNSSSLDTTLRLYRVGAGGVPEEIARNDDYFSKDSKIELTLGPGTYFVGVTASGNDEYDPTIADSGMNGTTQGSYELKLDFRKSATQSIVDRTLATGIIPDTLNVPFDGDGDGVPGGVYNFWFRAAPLTISNPNPAARARTIFVDKVAPAGGNGLLSSPYNNIQAAINAARPFDIVRIIGNGGADGNLATLSDNLAYQIGFGGASGSTPLVDGTELAVPKDVTVMIDAGAILQLRRSQIVVGSTSPSIFSDRSGGALQVLGTPTQSVYFTSYNELGPNSIGLDQNPFNVPPAAGDWGGINFKSDLDTADGRFDHETAGIFLNYVNHADIRFGGGQVNVDSLSQVVNPINILDRRPTVTFNTISNSSNAAMSANPDSFEETNFQAPRFWTTFSGVTGYNPSNVANNAPSASFTLDYGRVGPDIHGNRLVNNSTNALFVRTRTPAGNVLEELTVAGRFDDTDIVHVLEENLVVRGTPSGPIRDAAPPVELVFISALAGLGNYASGVSLEYKLVFVDALGNESPASQSFFASTSAANSAIFMQQLPGVPNPAFVARKLYRRTSPTQPFTLVDQIPASVTDYIDRNLPTSGNLQHLRVLPSSNSITRSRLDASLVIDPSIIIKSDGARIEVGIGATLVAEGFAGQEVIFTSLADDRYGAGSTFDTNSDSPKLPAAPVVATTVAGSATQNERQTVTLAGNPTAGGFTLTFSGQTTEAIAHNATAAALQLALENLPNVAPGDVAVTKAANVWTVTFQGAYANQNVPQMTASVAVLGSPAQAGDWGGLFFSADSQGSIDNAVFAYAGGLNRIEGTFTGFNALEIHQADVRVTQSKFEFNADGTGGQAPANRFGRGFNAPGTIFVRGAQPVIMDNVAINNDGAFINVNVNALNSDKVVDRGRQIGLTEREPGHLDNNGPLILRNRLRDNETNGMVVRGGTLTTEGVWDDTDIVHVLLDGVTIVDFHTFGGLRLESSATESLVVKSFGSTAGITATGRPLEIDDRIGGMLHILGQPGVPVVLTSLVDDTAGAGFTPEGLPQNDTNGDGSTGQPGSGVPSFPPATGPLTVTTNNDPVELVDGMLFRPLPAGVTISNETYVGAATAAGTYINGDAVPLQILPQGIILSSGAADIPASNSTQFFSVDHNTLGDADLSGLIGGTATFDAAVLEFNVDITSTSGILSGAMDFQFGSDEFDEFVGFNFNDVLGVFVNGVNYVRDSAGNLVTINSSLFNIDNRVGTLDIEYDGLTSGLTVTFPLQLGNNVIKIAIADATDTSVDTGALLTDLRFSTQPVDGGVSAIALPGDWQGITIDQWAHDRNVETILEREAGDGTFNSIPPRAQLLGSLGPFEKAGDENLRLGFTVHGLIGNPTDVDVYSFQGRSGTEVWIDLDRTTHALDSIVELVDNNGNVLARSNNSPAESAGDETRVGLARAMQKTPPFEGEDFYTTNQRDSGMRLLLPGPTNTTNTYFVRVRSNPASLVGEFGNSVNPGLTSGAYQLQVRLREVDEFGGSTVRFAKIANAVNGIRVIGQPTHSPLSGEAAETDTVANNVLAGAQFVGNMLNTDRGVLSIGGQINVPGDVDWYSFDVNYDATQGIPGVSTDEDWWSTIFDIDYADGFARANLVINVFDETGNLVLSSKDSNIADDRPNPLNGSDTSDLNRGSSGTADPWIGPIELPQGRYFVAVSSDNVMASALDQFTNAASTTPLVRLEPSNSVVRLVEDHIGSTGGSNVDTIEVDFINADSIVPWSLHDVGLYVTQDGSAANTTQILMVDPFTGAVESIVGRFNENTSDIAMHPRGRLYSYTIEGDTGNATVRFSDTNVGNYLQIDPGTGLSTDIGDDGIETYEQDPANANIAPVRPIPAAREGEGIHFRAIDIAVGFNPDYLGFAIGGRDAFSNINDFRNDPRNDYPNILYTFNPDTGAAISNGAVRTGNAVLGGAATQIVERGVLDTLIDFFPQGNADAVAIVEATIVDALNGDTTFQILDVGYSIPRPAEIPANFPSPTTFQVTQGFLNRTFEFDAGPEALFEINPNVINQQIRDTQGFSVNGARLEFDTGHVLNVTGVGNLANYPVGSTVTITDVDPDPLGPGTRAPIAHVFEFTATGVPTIPNALPIPVAGSASQMVDAIVNAINAAPGITTRAVRLGTTGRISLTNNLTAFPTINPNSDSTAAETAPGLGIAGTPGRQIDNSILVRIEETSVQADLRDAFLRTGNFPGINASGVLPLNSVPGVSGAVDGFSRITVGFDGNRINFSGASNITTQDPLLNASVFQPLGSTGGVTGGRVTIPFLAQDTAIQLGDRMVTALQNAGYTNVSRTPTGSAVIVSGGNFVFADAPLETAAEAPGGIITGLATINGEMYAVSDTGGLFRVVNPMGGAQLDYINTATELAGIQFSGLAAGPRHVEGGRYQNTLFGITEDGELHAFDTQGTPQRIFNSAFNPATGQIEVQTSVQTGLTNVHGLAFSNVDYNLWHSTPNRNTNDGHGINEVFDDSRVAVQGGSALYFGFESVGRNGISSGQLYAPTAGMNTYDMLGGAHGTVESNTFSLKGYTAADSPYLYFNYFLETEAAGHNPNTPIFMRDSFRVFIAGDDGEWFLLGTNNGNRFTPNPALPPNDEIDYAPLRVRELWDNTTSWRQARIPLGNFAGIDNLKLRFDFSTAGSMNVGDYTHLNGVANTQTVGQELRAVDGIYLRDGQNFTLGFPGAGSQLYTFDMGYTLVAPNGARIPDGARFTINGTAFEFDSNGTVGAGATAIRYLAADNPTQLASRIALAITTAMPGMPVQINGHRLNLRGGAPGTVTGANSVTTTNIPAGFVEGAPGVAGGTIVGIHSAMTRDEVREAIAIAMAGVNTEGIRAQVKSHNEIIRLIGIQLLGQTAGPNADPLNQRLLGITTQLPGDEFGAFNVGRNIDGTTNTNNPGTLRAQANNFEGVYIDDIIIGFAERGEMVTGTGRDTPAFANNPQADTQTNITTGAYQLEVRRGAEAGVPTGSTALPRLDLLPQINPNDRLGESRTLLAPAGNQISDGQFFTLSDGVNQVTFEFNDTGIPGSGVTQGRIRIDYTARDPDYLMAQRIRNAINSAPVQAVLKISAGLADGMLGTASTSNRLNLYGSISVPNAGTVPGSGIIAPPTGPEVNNGTLINNDVLVNAVGHFSVQPGPGGNVVDSGVTVQGVTQQFIDQNYIFDYLNYIDLGPGGEAFDLSTTTITQLPTLISPDLVRSAGTFDGPNGPINWVVDTTIANGSLVVSNTITFSSLLPLGNLRLINYLDEDVFAFDDDLLYQVGTPGQADYRLYTLDNVERVGFSQGGVYLPGPGLVNASYDGWAADAYNQLQTAILGLGTSYSINGNIDTADLPPRVDGKLGLVNGLADVTTAMAWSVDPAATTATITTFLELLPVDPPGNLNFITNTQQYGDKNLFRDQGQILLYGNEIYNSLEWGILVDAAPRDAVDGNIPHPGSVRNLPELNTQRLVPGVVIMNNTIYNSGTGGIRFSGDAANDASVPFGRIVNNTLYGQGGTLTGVTIADIGIQVDENAGPTLLNNVVANFATGVTVDASSQGSSRTVMGGALFQGNRTNSNIGLGSSFITVPDTQALFVNPALGNFYPAFGSPAIDSSVDSLLDRPALVTVRNPLGIAQSPILSPDRDGFGQLRVDDPNVNTPQGSGLNPFKDRGAIDRVDFVGPTSLLVSPPDNDAEGTDLDPTPTTVVRANDTLRDFRIQLIDRFDVNAPPEGSDIDDLTVSAAAVVLEVLDGPNAGVMVLGSDYSYAYDATNNTIVLTPSGGVWPLNQTYRITLNNSLTGIRDRAGNPLLPNQADGTSHFYTIFVGSAVDFGDAPASYGVLAADNGPSHTVNAGVRLGASIGAEADGQPSASANADTGDDGLVSYLLARGVASSVTIVASATGFMHVWVDLDSNGTFDDDEYLVQAGLFTTPGVAQVFDVGMLEDGPQGNTFMRIRFTTDTINSPLGPAGNGEVEDYQIQIGGPAYHNGNPNTVPADVDNNDVVNILDLLHVVNFITYLQSKLINPGDPLTVPPTSPPYRANDMPDFDPSGGGVPGAARYIDVSDVNPSGTGYGQINVFDLLAVVDYIVANFDSGDGEGEAPPTDGGEGEASPTIAPPTYAAAATTSSSTASRSNSHRASLVDSATLYAAGNITLETRERSASPLVEPVWEDESDEDDLLALMAVGQAAGVATDDESLAFDRNLHRPSPMGPLDADSWESLLSELAQDVGGLPDDDFLS
jgi:hypothetical protein